MNKLSAAIKANDAETVASIIKQYNLQLTDNKITADKPTVESLFGYWDKRQHVRKILLNSAYGALGNKHCTHFDPRVAQSVTLCGRQIVNHMMSKISEITEGTYSRDTDTIIYGDTDSCYFSIWHLIEDAVLSGKMDWTTKTAIDMYDEIADQVNSSFPDFMNRAFNVAPVNGAIIKAGREIVADSTLFIKKKRYAANIVDKEGKRKDKDGKRGEIKAMGLELKRSDTPKYVQEFLLEVLKSVLYGSTKQDVAQHIIDFKRKLQAMKSWEKGSPKSVNKLTMYDTKQKNSPTKVNMPGHVRAALNWNQLRKLNNDNQTMEITDGMKVTVCKLKNHPLKFTSIAYPVDETRLPPWFTELHFDDSEMEQILVDKKVENLLWVLNWNLNELTNIKNTFTSLFDFA